MKSFAIMFNCMYMYSVSTLNLIAKVSQTGCIPASCYTYDLIYVQFYLETKAIKLIFKNYGKMVVSFVAYI